MRASSLCLVLGLLGVGASFAAETPGAYKLETGPYAVGEIDRVVLTGAGEVKPDSDSGEYDTPLLIRYPKLKPAVDGAKPVEPARFPVVIFSHGAGGSRDAFPDLSKHWASHGYVVIHPTHGDSIKRRHDGGEDIRELMRDPQQVVKGVNLRGRHTEVRHILENFKTIERRIAEDSDAGSAPLLDPDRVVIAGHSAGAMTAQALGGMKFYINPRARARSMEEKRIKAAIIISGQGTTRRTITAKSWEDVHIPWLVIAGSEDYSPVSSETPQSRRHPFEFAPPGDKYLVYIDGATHSSYSGKRLGFTDDKGELKADIKYIQSIVASSTTAFLDAYMNKNTDARAFLTSDALTKFPGGKVEYQYK
ncbi:MAG: hypothetical protein KDA32_04095 [Phycisphaerales bacterium]|nr:hypothetical protein [Phycisphaerales bacterium]